MKKNFKESENTEGRMMIVYYDPKLSYSQSAISDKVFDQEFDDSLIFGNYHFNFDRVMDDLVKENNMDLAEYVDDNLKGIVEHIDERWEKHDSKLECDVFFAPGVDPEQYKDAVVDYLNGQMSDGWGEGFEQQEVTTTRIYAAYNEDEEWDCYLFANERDAERRAREENEWEPEDSDEEYDAPNWSWCEVNVSMYASFRKPEEVVVVPEFDEEGYNRSGYDKDGFDRSGKDREGFDRNGLKPLNNKTPNGRGANFAVGKDGRVRITNTIDMGESRKNARIRVAEAVEKRVNEGLFDQPFSVSSKEKAAQKALKKQQVNPVNPNLPEVGEVWTYPNANHEGAPVIRGLREFCKVVRYPATEKNPVMNVEEGAGCVLGIAKHPEKNVLVVFSLGLQLSKKYEHQDIMLTETTLAANEDDRTLTDDVHSLQNFMRKYMSKHSKDGKDFGFYEFDPSDSFPWGRFFISFTEKGEEALEDLNYYLTIKPEKPNLSDGFGKGVWGDTRLPIVKKGTYDKSDIVWGDSLEPMGAPASFKVRKNEFPELFGLKEKTTKRSLKMKESTSRGTDIKDIAFDYGYDLGQSTIKSEDDICTDDVELMSLYKEYDFETDVFAYFRRGYKAAAEDWLFDNEPLDECDNLNESEEQTYCPICKMPCEPYELDYYGMCSICNDEDCPEDEFDPFEEAEFYESKKRNAKIRIAEAKVRIAEAELKALKERATTENTFSIEVNGNLAGANYPKPGQPEEFESEKEAKASDLYKKLVDRYGEKKVKIVNG